MLCVSGREGLDHLVQAALVSGSLILINNAFVDHAVDHGHGQFEGIGSCRLVAFFDCADNVLDVGPHFRAEPHIVETRLFRLAGALPG